MGPREDHQGADLRSGSPPNRGCPIGHSGSWQRMVLAMPTQQVPQVYRPVQQVEQPCAGSWAGKLTATT